MSSTQPAQTNDRTANVVVDRSSPFQTLLCGVHGRRKDLFQGGTTVGFFKFFLGGDKSGEIFFPLETKKTTFFGESFNIQGTLSPFRRSWWSSQ